MFDLMIRVPGVIELITVARISDHLVPVLLLDATFG